MRVIYPFPTSWLDYFDNESLAVLVYVMGCERNCKGCHNPQFKDPDYAEGTVEVNDTVFDQFLHAIIRTCKDNLTNKIVFSGGDPLAPNNIKLVKEAIELLRMYCPEYQIAIYTAYDVSYVKENNVGGFTYLKTGAYQQEASMRSNKTSTYMQLASSNQKVYDSQFNLLSKDGIFHF